MTKIRKRIPYPRNYEQMWAGHDRLGVRENEAKESKTIIN